MGCGSSPGGAYTGGGHTCTPSWEVPSGHLAVHTGGRTPKHDGSDDRTVGVGNHDWERNEKGQRTEAIERPGGDGVLRRAAGDAAARSAHPGPDDRPRPPAASGVPVHSRAQATNGGRGRGLSGSRNHLPPLPVFVFHFPHFVAAAAPSTPQTAMFHLPHFVADTAP